MRILILLILLISANLFSQEALKIKYGQQFKFDVEEKIQQQNVNLSKAMKDAMNEVYNYEMILLNNEAEYYFVEKIDNKQTDHDGGNTISVSFAGGGKSYSNYDTGLYLESTELMGKMNIVKSELPKYEWELTRDTKEILGIKVRKAIIKKEDENIIAWYATEIPYKAGPENIWGLPGLILDYHNTMKTKSGHRITYIFAQEIEYLDAKLVKIYKPDESKSISKEQYNENIEELERIMMESYSQGVDK